MQHTEKSVERKPDYGEALTRAASRIGEKWSLTSEVDDFSKGYCQGLSEANKIVREEYERSKSGPLDTTKSGS